VRSRAADRSSRRLVALVVVVALGATACASLGARSGPPLTAEAEAARALIERRWLTFGDLRTLADLTIRRRGKTQWLSGPLLLRAPGSLRFEALTPLGPPALVVTSDADAVTIWEVLQNRAYLLSPTPEATGRWLGLPLGAEDLVAILSGNVRPLSEASSGTLVSDDGLGASLSLTDAGGTQRIWFDPGTGQPRQVEWTGGRLAARAVFSASDPGEPPGGVRLALLDGSLDVDVRYRNPRIDSGFDPDLLRVKLPEAVRIQDFRR
jgi:outer membrane lipoprotein-sorting protein